MGNILAVQTPQPPNVCEPTQALSSSSSKKHTNDCSPTHVSWLHCSKKKKKKLYVNEEALQHAYISLHSSQLQNAVLLQGPSLNITNTANQLDSAGFL